MEKTKSKRLVNSKNLKISTRITLSTIIAIILPLIIVSAFGSVFLSTMASYFNFSTVTTDSYSMLNQIQWSQTISSISNELISDNDVEKKKQNLSEFTQPIEKLGSKIYIDCNGEPFYFSQSANDIIATANKIVKVDTEKNMNYFCEDGIVIVTHAENEAERYLVIIVNDNYTVNDISTRYTAQDYTSLVFGKTGLVLISIAMVFVLSIVLLSILTSRTISKPIKELAQGADEIANGNLDFVINYESTNEIGTTVKSFNEMTTRLRDSINEQNRIEQSRKEMIAGVAHDLRTPLTSVKGYLEGLKDGIASTPEMQQHYLETIYSSTLDMERLLDDLLDISRLELGNIELHTEPININAMLSDCAEELKFTLEKKGIDFSYTNPNATQEAIVMLDTDRFSRVITNIISNSIKYAKKDIKLKIEMSIQSYEKSVIISISDNGIGIDNENLPRIFESFYRADRARSKTRDGSGLGLSVCRQIVELHGGRIWATSKEGEGTTILISMEKI